MTLPTDPRALYIRCPHCEGAGMFSGGHPNDPDSGLYNCPSCEDGETPGAAQDWDDAVALWRATPGDWDARMEVLRERYELGLVDMLGAAMVGESVG